MGQAVHAFFASAPRGMAPLLAAELRALGAGAVAEQRAGVDFAGDLAAGYRACLWSRLASRVLLAVDRFEAPTADALYDGIRRLPWEDHMAPAGTLAVDFTGTSAAIRNTHFGAQRVKDGVVDHFRQARGQRPSVDLERPDLRIHVHLYQGRAAVSVDLSGQALHRRGYRRESVEAPLKESLAAAVLARAGWCAVAAAGGPLVDLMCGSGTLLVEGAWMAADRAPALSRQDLGLLRWGGHDAALWRGLLEEARQRLSEGLARLPEIRGFDADGAAVAASRANAALAGLEDRVRVERRALAEVGPGVEPGPTGLVVANPPYGQRLSSSASPVALYAELAAALRTRFAGWQAAVLTPADARGAGLGSGRFRVDRLYNGALECRLVSGRIPPVSSWPPGAAAPGGPGAQMLANRLRKNRKALGKWARQQGITCYRLYDGDMPEYAVAVDLYQTEGKVWAHVQEYRAPSSIDPGRAAARLQEALSTIAAVLEIPTSQLLFRVRERQKGTAQYRRLGDGRGAFHEVREGPWAFLVNFTDYLDTGLFLDHRPTRCLIGQLAAGKRFLNLFGYTGTATVCAAAAGAAATTTVDLSRTYLDWARRNLELNGLGGPAHALVQADCSEWLAAGRRERFDLIFLDPPTFSNSKRMASHFDVQRDHPGLIARAAGLLADGGALLFSTHFRHFRLQAEALAGLRCEDLSRATIPRDFERNPRIHQCFRIERAR